MWLDKLKELKKASGFTTKDIADRSGLPGPTLEKIFSGATKDPKLETMRSLVYAMGYTLDDLDDNLGAGKRFTPTEQGIIKKYRDLDDHGKEMVALTLDCEVRRMEDDRQRPEKVVELFPTRKYLQPASAGFGDFNDDASYEMVDLVKRPPVGTSFIITAHGDSMEPTYHDGDLLFVRAQERIELGDIGLFTRGPNLYIKESGPDGLISHNRDEYPDPITGTEDEPILAQGKVLGVCTADYFLHI